MNLQMKVILGTFALALLPKPASAQSTDGFHEILVFPVVVDSTSFGQRFSFRTTQSGTAPVSVRYYPAVGTSQASAMDCPGFDIPWGGKTFEGLRAICPGLAAGSQFGFLVLEQTGTQHRPFSGYSRVSNATGVGFSVEAFAGHDFTSAISTATGLRRKAATAGAPAFQTNCFIGLMGEHDGPASTTRLLLGMFDENGDALGTALTYDLLPGQMVRVLDIFSAVGAPAGDYDRASLVARQVSHDTFDERPGLIAFCTVQDNTSFGADFRVAKQEYGVIGDTALNGPGAYDSYLARVTYAVANPRLNLSGLAGSQSFDISPGSPQQNDHLAYFRHPDWASCELVDLQTHGRMDPSVGLELRLLGWNEAGTDYEVLAGGDGITGWSRIYLGDKRERVQGMNTMYLLQVESNEPGPEAIVNYGLRCESGSGGTRAQMISYHRAANEF